MLLTDTLRYSTPRSSESATCIRVYGDAKSSALTKRAKQATETRTIPDTGVCLIHSCDEQTAMVYEKMPPLS
jgi:hypothetical protein